MSPAMRDLANAGAYLAALAALLAASTLSCAMLLRALPALVGPLIPAAETSGSGATAEPRYVPWRLSPEEAQRKFATRSAVLLPPTPAFPEPPGGWPSYAAVRKGELESGSLAAIARSPTSAGAGEPMPKLAAPIAQADFQMSGR